MLIILADSPTLGIIFKTPLETDTEEDKASQPCASVSKVKEIISSFGISDKNSILSISIVLGILKNFLL